MVATNASYGKLCRRSLKRLPARYRSLIDLRSFSSLEEVTIPDSPTERMLFISRLSDIPKERVEKAWEGAESKHLLFLAGLPVEAMPSRLLRLNIRNPHRLHLAAERSSNLIEELVYRLMSGMAHVDGPQPIVDAWIENQQMVVLSPSFDRLAVPLNKLAKFIGTNEKKINAFDIDEDGCFLYWPHADVHLGWEQLEQIVDPSAALEAKQKSKVFNKRYGAAIRSIREEHGLKQSDIDGVTDRHLRRVEHGEQAASKAMLNALAKAHGMSLEEYLKVVAKQLGSI